MLLVTQEFNDHLNKHQKVNMLLHICVHKYTRTVYCDSACGEFCVGTSVRGLCLRALSESGMSDWAAPSSEIKYAMRVARVDATCTQLICMPTPRLKLRLALKIQKLCRIRRIHGRNNM